MNKRLLVAIGVLAVVILALVPTVFLAARPAAVPAADQAAADQVAAAQTNEASELPAPTSPPASPTVEATTAPTAVPPTETPRPFAFPRGSQIAGVDVGGLDVKGAEARVEAAMRRYNRTISLTAPDYTTTLDSSEFVEFPAVNQLIESGRTTAAEGEVVNLPLELSVDRPALEAFVEELAPDVTQAAATSIITDSEAITQTYTFIETPGRELDVERTVRNLELALADPDLPETVELELAPARAERLPMAELDRALREHAGYWDGIAAFYVHDLETGETLAYNADTVFSGASIMKVPIMIFAYSRLGALDEQQQEWMRKMIIDSENLEANDLLAASVGSQGTEAALQGVQEMSQMLADLGLDHTYQLIPYESGEWLTLQGLLPPGGPAQEGAEPFTAPDPYIRTTPRQMGELFVMLDECARGTGRLLEQVGGELNPELCEEMVEWLQQPHDPDRMVAGLPAGTKVAHKGGWIDDMQSDVGIVDSPGGRYVAAIYLWRDGYVTDVYASPSPYLADFSHTIYTFFNPEPPIVALEAPATSEETTTTTETTPATEENGAEPETTVTSEENGEEPEATSTADASE